MDWVQIDEPILGLDLPADWLAAYQPAYTQLAAQAPRLLLASYFASVLPQRTQCMLSKNTRWPQWLHG